MSELTLAEQFDPNGPDWDQDMRDEAIYAASHTVEDEVHDATVFLFPDSSAIIFHEDTHVVPDATNPGSLWEAFMLATTGVMHVSDMTNLPRDPDDLPAHKGWCIAWTEDEVLVWNILRLDVMLVDRDEWDDGRIKTLAELFRDHPTTGYSHYDYEFEEWVRSHPDDVVSSNRLGLRFFLFNDGSIARLSPEKSKRIIVYSSYKDIPTITELQLLYKAAPEILEGCLDKLPTYGGEEPEHTLELLSYDEHHVMAGNDGDIMTREAWAELNE